MYKKYITYVIFSNLLLILIGCKKFVEVDAPRTQLVTTTVFENNTTANSAQMAIYSKISDEAFSYNLSAFPGLSADELTNYSTIEDNISLYTNSLTAANERTSSIWASGYGYILDANAILEGLEKSQSLDISVKKQLTGESKFIRAFVHYYLTNLFGDVPVITTTDYKINSLASRTAKSDVYGQIISDLKDAQSLLVENYVGADGMTTTSEKVRPNRATATALLARVFLDLGDYEKAELEANLLIADPAFAIESDLNNVFIKNSSEAIWQLQPVIPTYNTVVGLRFILTDAPGTGVNNSTVITNNLFHDFDSTDNRKKNWIGSIVVGTDTFYFPFKYKIGNSSEPPSEYTMVFRLAEQYLIRAESRARSNDIEGAVDDLNVLRSRAGTADLAYSLSQTEVLSAIGRERRLELFTEWGDRWITLKRMSIADDILPITKGTNWQTTDQLYPIPQTERNNDPNLTQNSGY